MEDPTTPAEAYKAIIDCLVSETCRIGGGDHVLRSGSLFKTPENRKFNDFLASLSGSQRELLARMLQAERDAAIHDVLAALTWWITIHEVGLTFRGEPMPMDWSWEGMHGDYVARRNGWEWPTEPK